MVNQKRQNNELTCELSGAIDEDATFPTIDQIPTTLVLDLKGVRSINSCGIREWVRWLTPIAKKAKISFVHCPKVIVDQMNMVEGFLPGNCIVDSFFVPYYCEETDDDAQVLMVRGRDYEMNENRRPGKMSIRSTLTIDGKRGTYEIDIIESKYFKFLGI